MPTWVSCTDMSDGSEIRVNVDHVATVQQHKKDRGGTGSVVTFVGGVPSSIIIREDQEHLTGGLVATA